MYIRYQIGNPSIKTESVVQKLEVTMGRCLDGVITDSKGLCHTV